MGRGLLQHVEAFHSHKLCSVNMPPALNKPVAAPGVEPPARGAIGGRDGEEKCIMRAGLLLWLHTERCHIFSPELHIGLCAVFTSLYIMVRLTVAPTPTSPPSYSGPMRTKKAPMPV